MCAQQESVVLPSLLHVFSTAGSSPALMGRSGSLASVQARVCSLALRSTLCNSGQDDPTSVLPLQADGGAGGAGGAGSSL